MKKFTDFQLSEPVIRAINNMGFEETTPIQEKTIPLGLEGKDLIAQAPTGTGKTAAFGIPMVERFEPNNPVVQGVVITPTRELAIQVGEELNRIGQYTGLRALPIYGGQDISRQIKALKRRPQIIVGTPGRMMDHLRRRTLKFDKVKIAVLDEADEMLNMGFIEDIETILEQVSSQRQTLLFSATMPKPIQELAKKFMEQPELVQIQNRTITVDSVEQGYVEVPERKKFDVLCNFLDIHSPEMAIVFGRTKRRVDELAEALSKRGYLAEGIHGDLTQPQRDSVMRRFKAQTIEILVATDVAARGLDISGVTHVYNFDIPQDPESYVHRIGRTGRAGNTGSAMTFITPRESDHLRVIERITRGKLVRHHAPSLYDALEGQQQQIMERILITSEQEDLSPYRMLAQQLLEQVDSVSLVAASLKLLTKEPNTTSVQLTAEAPLRTQKKKNNGKKRYGGRGGGQRRDNKRGRASKKNYK